MEERKFVQLEHGSANTVTEIQKEAIRIAILNSISNSPYYEGLELKACKAISNINKFSDAKFVSEIEDTKTGFRYSATN